MPGKREMKPESSHSAEQAAETAAYTSTKKPVWFIPALLALVLLLGCVGFCAYAATRQTIAPHTSVGGTDVGALTQEEAAARIAGELDALRRENGVRVTLENGEEAAYLSYEALGVSFDAEALARAAYDSAHSGNPIADAWRLLRAMLGSETNLAPVPRDGWTADAAQLLADAAEVEPLDFSFAVDDANHLFMTKKRDGRSVDVSALRALLVESASDAAGERSVALPYRVVPAQDADLDAVKTALGGEMANARYDKETQTILPEQMAVVFDAATAQALLDAAAPGETVEVPAELRVPEVTAEELQKVLFRDVLGTYTTRVGGAAGRKSNVKLTASRVNGTILNSGEEFNYYSLTGPFSAANGYQSAPGYFQGKTVPMDGGGACQCSSTTYAAALLANMEIVARTAHGFASDYIGLGLDATVSGGGPYFIFRNNTAYPVKVEATYSSNNRLTVSIIGTKTDNITVKMRTEVLSTTPFSEQIIEDPTLAPGTRVVDTTPYTGYVVNTYRQLYDGDGKLISETFEARSKYNKRDRIIKVGPAADAAVAPPDGSAVPADSTIVDPVPVDPGAEPIQIDPPVVDVPAEPTPQPAPETPVEPSPAPEAPVEAPAETEAA